MRSIHNLEDLNMLSFAGDIVSAVGNTPLLRLSRLVPDGGGEVYVKLESANPAFSVKDRIAVGMVEAAERSGELEPGGVIIEATSGNTGLGLAMVAAARGYKLIIAMPETMSAERMSLLRHFGVDLRLTPGENGMAGAVDEAERVATDIRGAFMPRQFENEANPAAHYAGTAPEIWEALDGEVDAFVAGVGTGGTLTGCGRYFKERNPDVAVVAVEPDASPVLSGGAPGKHGIQGIGAGFVPKVLDLDLIDEIVRMSDSDAVAMSREAARSEGILCGISSGANIRAAVDLASRSEYAGKRIVTVVCDTGERYLSTPLFDGK